MALIGVPIVLFVLLIIGVVPLVIAYLLLRRSDPEHALRRTAGLGVVSLGTIAFGICGLFILAVLAQGDQPILEADYTPNSSSTASYGGVHLGAGALSVWLLLSGAAIGWGVSLFTKRFSLRSLLIAFCLLALIASTPQFLVQPRDRKAVLTAEADHVLSSAEWMAMEKALQEEQLCASMADAVKEQLPMPVKDALTLVEVTPRFRGELESNGTIGAQLLVRFSGELSQHQIQILFAELDRQIQQAIPPAQQQ